MRWLVFVATAVGCGRIGYAPRAGPTDGDPIDGVADGVADAVACSMPAVFDDFSAAGPPCGTWGFATNLVASARLASALHVAPPAPATNQVANCTADGYAFDRGTFVEISSVITAPSGYVQLAAFDPTHAIEMIYYVDSGKLEVADETGVRANLGAAPYDPIAMRWWRLRRASGGMAAEYSPNGRSWIQLGFKPATSTMFTAGRVVFGAGYYATESSPGTTVIEGWNVCPPG